MKSFKARLDLKEGIKPKFCRPRTVPFAIKETVGKELDQLEEAGIVIKENYMITTWMRYSGARLQEHSVRLKQEKCSFYLESVE